MIAQGSGIVIASATMSACSEATAPLTDRPFIWSLARRIWKPSNIGVRVASERPRPTSKGGAQSAEHAGSDELFRCALAGGTVMSHIQLKGP